MTADTKIFVGGDAGISTAFEPDNMIQQRDNSVNRLIIECRTSKESLAELYEMFKKSVFAVAFGITADYHLAEDCVAETFVRLTTVRNFSEKKGDGKGFILTIARNVALELRRRYQKEAANFIIQSYGEAEQTVEDSIFINHLLKHLNDKQRQIVILRCCAESCIQGDSKNYEMSRNNSKIKIQKGNIDPTGKGR